MTWVLGRPLYDDDAIEIARNHLVKEPDADDWRYIQAAHMWVADRTGLIEAFSCWVGNMPEIAIAAYVEYVGSPTPPEVAGIDREELISWK